MANFPRKRRKARWLPVFVALLALLSRQAMSPAAAQEPEEPRDQGETPLDLGVEERVDVELAIIDFIVLDARDRTVPFLTKDDFALKVRGTKTPIASLDRRCRAREEEARPSEPKEAAEPPELDQRIVMVFDYDHMIDVAEVFDRALAMLDRLPTGEKEHMIVSFSGLIRIETPFTTELDELRWTLRRMRNDRDLYARHRGDLTQMQFFERVRALFDLLERWPGQKQIVMFSGPFIPDGRNYDEELRDLAALSASIRASVYPVDSGGLRTAIDPHASAFGGPTELRRLANQTGGRMTSETNDVTLAYARADRDLDCTYTLGFRHTKRKEDRNLCFSIKVRGVQGYRAIYPGCHVVRSEEKKRLSRIKTAALAPHMFESEEISTEIIVTGAEPRGWRTVAATAVRLTPESVAQAGDTWELRGFLRRPNGTVIRKFRENVTVLEGSPGQAARATTFHELTVPPGDHVFSVMLSDPDGQPHASTRPVSLPELPKRGPFLLGPILGRSSKEIFEPLSDPQAAPGSSLEALTVLCVAVDESTRLDEPVTVRRWISDLGGDRIREFDDVSFQMKHREGLRCRDLIDPVEIDGLRPGTYALTASVSAGDWIANESATEFTVLGDELHEPEPAVPGSRLVRGQNAEQLERRLRATADEGYRFVASDQGTDVSGGSQVAVLLERVAGEAPAYDYRVVSCSGSLRDDAVRATIDALGAEGYRLRPRSVSVRKMGDHWLPDSAHDDQMILIFERRADERAQYQLASVLFGDYEPFYAEFAERRGAGYDVIGMWSTDRRLQVILQRRVVPGADAGPVPVREHRILIAATRLVLGKKLETAGDDGFRMLAIDDPTITGPPVILLERSADAGDVLNFKFLDDLPEKRNRDELDRKLTRKAGKGWRVTAHGTSTEVITLERPARRKDRTKAEYRMLSSRKSPGLDAALQQAAGRGFQFVGLFSEPDETTVLVVRETGEAADSDDDAVEDRR